MTHGDVPYPDEGSVHEPRQKFPRLARLRARLVHIESIYGDLWSATNASGLRVVLEASRADEVAPLSLQRYFYARLQDELVPRDLGGRFEALDQLALTHRALFRRDPAVGHSVGFLSFMAALLVYLNGSAMQQSSVSETLLHRGLLGIAFPSYLPGGPAQACEFTVAHSASGFEINGAKLDIANAHTADQIIAFARSGEEPAAYSLLLLDPASADPATVRLHPPIPHFSVRGTAHAGIEFSHHKVCPDALIGTWNHGLEAGAAGLPAVHALLPALLIGLGDTALRRVALSEVRQGEPRSGNTAALARCFVDLLAADALSLVAARSVQVQPGESAVVAAASRYVVPILIRDLLSDLRPIMGDGFHATDGDDAVVAKHLSDLTQMAFSGVGLSNALNTITPYLSELGDHTPDGARPVDPDLFRLDVEPPCLEVDALRRYGGNDGLLAYLGEVPEKLEQAMLFRDDAGEVHEIGVLVGALREVVGDLRTACGGLEAEHGSENAFALANRYAHLLVAVSAIGLWLNAGSDDHHFMRNTAWLRVALSRCLGRLGQRQPPIPDHVHEEIFDEIGRRCRERISLDLFTVAVGGAQ